MANYSNLGSVLAYAGNVPVAYPAAGAVGGGVINAGAGQNLKLYVKIVTDAASSFTGVGIKLQESYDASAGSFLDVLMTDNAGTGTTANEKVQTVTAGTTTWVVLSTSNARLANNLQVIVKGNGGAAKAGDAITVYAMAW